MTEGEQPIPPHLLLEAWDDGIDRTGELIEAEPDAPEERLVILLNSNVKMTRGKAAAQAVHAALYAYGIEHGAVVVLGGKPGELRALPVQIADAGRTEIEPGTLTAATSFAVRSPEHERLRAENERLRTLVTQTRGDLIALEEADKLPPCRDDPCGLCTVMERLEIARLDGLTHDA